LYYSQLAHRVLGIGLTLKSFKNRDTKHNKTRNMQIIWGKELDTEVYAKWH